MPVSYDGTDLDNARRGRRDIHEAVTNTDHSDVDDYRLGYAYESLPTPQYGSSLVGWWPLHRDFGDAVDLSGNGNHGTVNGPTRNVAGRGGLPAYDFDGSNDSVTYPSQGSLFDGTNDYTATVWMNLDRQNIGSPQRFWHPRADYDVSLEENGGSLQWNFYDGSTHPISTSSFSLNEWIHLAGVWDATNNERRFYKDGSLVGTDTTGSPNSQDDSNAWGGNPSQDDYYVQGQQVDGRIYDTALSQSDIQTIVDWGSGDRSEPPDDSDGGVAYYKLDGDATDSWGSNDGTTSGGLVYSSDAIRGQSGDFDGSDDNIDTGIGSISTPASFSLWVKTNSSNYSYAHMISNYDDSAGWSDGVFGVGLAGSADTIESHVHGTSTPAYNLPTTVWNHVVVTYDESYIRVYRNGQFLGKTAETSTSSFNNVNFRIGSDGNPDRYIGANIDGVRIYDRALEPWEVHEVYNWGTRGIDLHEHTTRA